MSHRIGTEKICPKLIQSNLDLLRVIGVSHNKHLYRNQKQFPPLLTRSNFHRCNTHAQQTSANKLPTSGICVTAESPSHFKTLVASCINHLWNPSGPFHCPSFRGSSRRSTKSVRTSLLSAPAPC